MKRIYLFLTLTIFLLLVSFSLPAQQQGSITGGLNGVITDSTGAVLPGATVTLVGPQGTRTLTTDGLGRFSTAGLTPGYYDVTVEKTGFKKVIANHNLVVVNNFSALNLSMQPGNVSETVEVRATAISIDTQSTAITHNLTDTFYNSVPMPRNVSAIFYAAPSVIVGQVAGTPGQIGPGSANPSIGGASGLDNLYVVDGVTITDQAFGSIGTYNRYHGSLGTGINLAFIKEVSVKTTAFEPEYGKATGGIVQIVTKSGGTSYHGAVAAYFGPGSWYASRYQFYQFGFLQATPPSTLSSPQYDAAIEFGGYVPGMKNQLFFFGAFNPALRRDVMQANPNAPPPSVALGALNYSTTTLSWAGKLTYTFGLQSTFEVSAFGDPSRHNAQPFATGINGISSYFPETTASSWTFGSRNEVARVTTAITPRWTADASYANNYNHFDEIPASNGYGITDASGNSLPSPAASITQGLGAYEPSKNNTWSIAVNTTRIFTFLGQHTVSVGYAYDHTNFLDLPSRSGALFVIPNANEQGTLLTSLFSNIPARSAGALTNAQFRIAATNTDPTLTLTDRTCP
ncbi:MAG: TonB-dependent receptor, partial [Acidobacteriaceae bacterium]|nr:TonB-dependent receptor [Acidobacteriaceae bacterium]